MACPSPEHPPSAGLLDALTGAADRKRIQELLLGGWTPPPPDHPLAGVALGHVSRRTPLVLLGPANRVGARYFQILLRWRSRLDGGEPALVGLHNHGRYPQHSWVEVISTRAPHTAEEDALFHLLGRSIKPGGHLMVEYESPRRRETERALTSSVPPLLTPLGAALFRAGFGCGFKDWYISEGWSEGPRKLQGFKALDHRHRATKEAEMALEVLDFLRHTADRSDDPLKRARSLAVELLPCLSLEDPRVREAIQEALASL